MRKYCRWDHAQVTDDVITRFFPNQKTRIPSEVSILASRTIAVRGSDGPRESAEVFFLRVWVRSNLWSHRFLRAQVPTFINIA